ncbi:DCC1-like thiol-disulfide oxidoreductase family protein [Solitalea sp. MAHUQ-68]|uniref:DCC1-like thiol-disulfide oxidoreductase family protein n=1 Tax=Solitalea agri TaxID=2953739 RepID=A0A9X2F282_9SPHI|nr:DCC1-like thiol-disulfide oxidoreductase family protein [Solitalea agri]MCO4292774.1 DCC1-like thiol-disulfide oxidoreductase family protein [Solitalea agri]
MKTLLNKIIVYDSNCRICTGLKDKLLQFTSIEEERVVAFALLNDELIRKIDSDRFKNAMALIDVQNGDTIYGSQAIAYIFSTQNQLIEKLLSLKQAYRLFNFLYQTLAYNRYIIATPKSQFACDCFPDKVIRFRIAYILQATSLSVFLTCIFGISLKGFFPALSNGQAAMQMLLMAGTGWVIQIALAAICLRDKAIDYIGHLASIMVVGLLILVPWMLIHFIAGVNLYYLPLISVLFSSWYMLKMHLHRINYLQLPKWLSVSWFILLQITAVCWVYYFHFNN